MSSSKRSRGNPDADKSICNLCNKNKRSAAGMIKYIDCKQWVHCSCSGLKYHEAKKLKANFICKDCTHNK